ncbi:MAG: histidine phosphatase family protein [Bacteroidetes bacterium]|nr:histidine phosphatase family protein [Bacteroidota bacterium]
MIEKEIYIVRHGQTDLNAQGIVQGKGVNHSLNDLGRSQAQAFYEAYKDLNPEVMFSSTLKRAQETLAPFHAHNIPHIIDSDLDEISWGKAEGVGGLSDTSDEFYKLMSEWDSGNIHHKIEGGESPYELQQRQLRFIERLKQASERKILIATHGRFIRAFMCTITDRPLQDMNTFQHTNLCLYKVNLLADGRFEIEMSNETAHLAHL